MYDVSGSIRRPFVAALAVMALGATAVACSEEPDPAPAPPPEAATSATEPSGAAPTSDDTSAEETTGTEAETESSTSETATADDDLGEGVAEAKEIFAPILPAEMWTEFESCSFTGLQDSYECSGSEVGQFQLFESRSKAAGTTQLLTELRSSRVVRDTGRFVIGWSTLGTTAVVTVVDNEEGLVAQQLVSADQVEPDERIAELGLDQPAGLSEDPEATDTEWETYKEHFTREETTAPEEPSETAADDA